MKKYAILVLAFGFMLSVSISAQDQIPSQGKRGEKKELRQGDRVQITPETRASKMAKDLNLSDTEKVNVQSLFEKQDVESAKFRSEVSRESDDFRPKFKEFRLKQDAELKAVIGDEKFQILQDIRTEQRKMRPGNSDAPKN